MKKIVFALLAAGVGWFGYETYPMAAFWLVFALLLTWFVLANGFIVYMASRAVLKRDEDIHWFLKIPAAVMVVLGAPADVLFNWVAGSILFKEWPREGVFTTRCKRHKRGSPGWRRNKAIEWCRRMNKFGQHC